MHAARHETDYSRNASCMITKSLLVSLSGSRHYPSVSKIWPSFGKIEQTDNQGLFSIPQQVMDTKYITR